ncbi:NAD(P)-binding domain-containing protein [Caenimonas sp. SL110]|uniref:NAD(P)-binding domain-containing protein n=1 Tax=Caenimonas sp. SL110 TaxID=1450524 RepID=UPI0009E56572|nr:NAD(P)-binding domain-containing protein [Caenimonas sp. SL110]
MKLALIGGGMVGQCYAQAFAASGAQICGIADAHPPEVLYMLARALGTPVHTTGGAWLADADVVVSAVFGAAAREVATAALGQMRAGALFVDMTTADPEDMVRANNQAIASGHHFVDVAITGAVNIHGAKTPLLCAGERAGEVATLYRSIGSPIQIVGARPGDAASLKLLRSIFTKGLEALSVECLTTAERRGLRSQLHDILSDVDKGSLRAQMESMVCTHIEHSARRRKEVAEAQRQMRMAGIDPLVLPAVESLFERTATRQACMPYQGKSIEAALQWLLDASAQPAGAPANA